MKKIIFILIIGFPILLYGQNSSKVAEELILPKPQTQGKMSVEEALSQRRSQRNYKSDSLTQHQLSQILWSAYGITKPYTNPVFRGGLRTAPSAGALFPLEVYVIIGAVKGIKPGIYKYLPDKNALLFIQEKDLRQSLFESCRSQTMVKQAPISLLYTANFQRTTMKYGDRGKTYVYIDLGHSAQNVYLQATAMGLGTCAIGAFEEEKLRLFFPIPEEETPVYVMPVGYYIK